MSATARQRELVSDLVKFCRSDEVSLDQFDLWIEQRDDLTDDELASLRIAVAMLVIPAQTYSRRLV